MRHLSDRAFDTNFIGMCGRQTHFHTWQQIHEAMSIIPEGERGRNTPARYNITPTQDLTIVAEQDGEIVVRDAMWWLVPFWAKERPKYQTFNARSETAPEKPTFRESFKHKRCLIPASGYYEWSETEDGEKHPWHIQPADREPFAFAGLWAVNRKIDANNPIVSCSVLTSTPDPAIERIHHRMPVILKRDAFEAWIDPETSVDRARNLLHEHRGGELTAYRVSREVNKNTAQGAHLIEPLSV